MTAQPPEPDWSQAVVPDAKITRYLLNADHPEGKHKAVVFTACGYDSGDPERLAHDLVRCAKGNPVTGILEHAYGTNYEVIGEITSPSGKTLTVCTVWVMRPGDARPHLVTAYPDR